MGLSYNEVYLNTMRTTVNRIRGFNKFHQEKAKMLYEKDRLFTWMLINIQIDKKNKISTPEKLYPFPWEKKKDNDSIKLSKEALLKFIDNG